MSIQTAREIVASQDSGIAPIVRVPYGELTMATRVLDGGALVVILHVDTAEEAREIADKLRYPRAAIARWAAAKRSSTTRPCRSAR